MRLFQEPSQIAADDPWLRYVNHRTQRSASSSQFGFWGAAPAPQPMQGPTPQPLPSTVHSSRIGVSPTAPSPHGPLALSTERDSSEIAKRPCGKESLSASGLLLQAGESPAEILQTTVEKRRQSFDSDLSSTDTPSLTASSYSPSSHICIPIVPLPGSPPNASSMPSEPLPEGSVTKTFELVCPNRIEPFPESRYRHRKLPIENAVLQPHRRSHYLQAAVTAAEDRDSDDDEQPNMAKTWCVEVYFLPGCCIPRHRRIEVVT